MKRFLLGIAAWLICSGAHAQTIDALGAAGALGGTENVPIFQTANPAVKTTVQAIANTATLSAGCSASVTNSGHPPLTVSTQYVQSPNTTTIAMNSYTLTASDLCTNVTLPSGYTGGLTIPATATAGFGNGSYGSVDNQSGIAQTVTITTNNIDGFTSFILPNGNSFSFNSDGTNYHFTAGGQNFAGDQRHAVADAAYVMVSGDRIIAYTSITSSRIVTLPAANTQTPGARITIVDESGSVTPAIIISVAPNGADTIQGSNVTWAAIATARGFVEFESDGSSKWTVTRRSVDEQLFTGTGTWNRVVGIPSLDIFACGQGGGGGGGIGGLTNGSGGAGGGGADCRAMILRAADAAAAGGTSAVTITTNTNAGAGGASPTAGTQGGSSSFVTTNGTLTWFGGGGGGVGVSGALSTGGGGANAYALGTNNGTALVGCGGSGSGGGGVVGVDGLTCGAGGGGSSSAGVARTGGFGSDFGTAPGGASGGGVSASTGITAATGTGGKSLGCGTPPTGGGLNTGGGGPTSADFPIHPGCGGAGGGGATTGTGGTGSAGTGGAGGGGGGSGVPASSGGPGGQGGSGFVFVRGR